MYIAIRKETERNHAHTRTLVRPQTSTTAGYSIQRSKDTLCVLVEKRERSHLCLYQAFLTTIQ